MNLHLTTPVAQYYVSVLDGFDVDLSTALSPPFPRLKILRFDGSAPGDVVEVELVAGPIRRRWTSLITERHITDQAAWFVDEGQELPAPLAYWHHKHLITKENGYSIIHDQIEYKTNSKMLDLLLYPIIYAQFAMRGPVYKRVFGNINR